MSKFALTLPRHLSLQAWANNLVLNLDGAGNPPQLLNENNWQAWATQLSRLPTVANYGPPNPRLYADWRLWANDLMRTLY